MLYLVLAIISSTLIAITMRIGKKYCENDISMLAVNYVCCTVLSAYFTGIRNFQAERSSIGLGVIQGVLFLASFMLYQYNIQKNGVVMSTTFMKLGVLVPTLASIFIFKEQPTVLQILGVVLSVSAIIVINTEKGASHVNVNGTLIALLIVGGTTDIMAKVYEQYGEPACKDQFIFFTFVVALVLCTGLAVYRKEKITGKDILCGIIIGIPNYFSAIFLLKALHEVMATIAYSTYSVATIALAAVAGEALFKERLTKRQAVGLVIILGALICLNVK